jgi:small subunit ribosomal protein S18
MRAMGVWLMGRRGGRDATKRGNDRAQAARARAGRPGKPKVCTFCVNKTEWIDYKDIVGLRRLMSDRGKIKARRVTGTCRQHQREVAIAIKTARELALLPYAVIPATADKGGRRGGRDGGRFNKPAEARPAESADGDGAADEIDDDTATDDDTELDAAAETEPPRPPCAPWPGDTTVRARKWGMCAPFARRGRAIRP